MAIELIGLQIREPIVPQLRLEFDASLRGEFRVDGTGLLILTNTSQELRYSGNQISIAPQAGSVDARLDGLVSGTGELFVNSAVNAVTIGVAGSEQGSFGGGGLTIGPNGALRMIQAGVNAIVFKAQVGNANPLVGVVPDGASVNAVLAVYNSSDQANSVRFIMQTVGSVAEFRTVTAGAPANPITHYQFNDVPVRFVQQVRAGVGALATPPLSFEADRDTGFFNNVDSSVQFVSNGVAVGGFDAAGITIVGGLSTFRLPDGSFAAPSLTFLNDTNTGLYLNTADTLGITTGGVSKVEIGTTQLKTLVVIRNVNGTLATPAYSFTADLDSGLYLGGVGDVRLSVEGADRITATATLVTITTAAIAFNNVAPIITLGTNFAVLQATAAGLVYNLPAAATAHTFQTNTSTRMTVNDTFIAAVVPIRASNGVTATPAYVFSSEISTGMWFPGSNNLAFSTLGIERLRLSATSILSTVPFFGPNGAFSLPTYSFVAVPTTGMFADASNLYFGVNAGTKLAIGTGALIISSGIGLGMVPVAVAGTLTMGAGGFFTQTNTGVVNFIVTAGGVLGATAILYITAAAGAADWSIGGVRWADGTPPVLSTVAGAVDLIYLTQAVGGVVTGTFSLGHI